jgi:hypothetical protein
MKTLTTLVVCIVLGVAISLATGLITNTPAQLACAAWYGYPFAWLTRNVIALQNNPWKADLLRLLLNVVFWSAVVCVVVNLAWCKACRQGKSPSA